MLNGYMSSGSTMKLEKVEMLFKMLFHLNQISDVLNYNQTQKGDNHSIANSISYHIAFGIYNCHHITQKLKTKQKNHTFKEPYE